MRFKVTFKLPRPISVIVENATGEGHAVELAIKTQEGLMATGYFLMQSDWYRSVSDTRVAQPGPLWVIAEKLPVISLDDQMADSGVEHELDRDT